jgi:hypothetical protein
VFVRPRDRAQKSFKFFLLASCAMLKVSSTFKPCLRSLTRPVASTSTALPWRAISASAPHSARRGPPLPEPETVTEELDEAMTTEGDGERSNIPTSYKEFMDKIGYKYQYAKPQQYLGETVSSGRHLLHATTVFTSLLAIPHESILQTASTYSQRSKKANVRYVHAGPIPKWPSETRQALQPQFKTCGRYFKA